MASPALRIGFICCCSTEEEEVVGVGFGWPNEALFDDPRETGGFPCVVETKFTWLDVSLITCPVLDDGFFGSVAGGGSLAFEAFLKLRFGGFGIIEIRFFSAGLASLLHLSQRTTVLVSSTS
eukprot:CAMPEP_0170511262 /NCGR_PEP_ID=MMETSP0208-20121228/66212_1 /TAXON_ID=197538 /ORGANISM="Strombidium inclinatum, Strain S3" /LENGTH=121 /DNA_ID=CAMNT_0010794791 /DNA_START=2037 /DNA_END=2399 /DNA_ORIENTATION=+